MKVLGYYSDFPATYDPNKVGRYLGAGVSREVYEYGKDKVIKFSKKNRGWWGDNYDEARYWESAPEFVKKYLAPVYSHADDYSWLIMAKAKTNVPTNRYGDPLVKLPREIRNRVYDLHAQNLGKFHRRYVAIDYAANELTERAA